MEDEYLIKIWNMGLTKIGVAKEYMKDNNKKARTNKDIKRITEQQALKHVEPILFRYRMKRRESSKR